MNNMDLHKHMEEVRKKMEGFEEDPSKNEDQWKKALDSLIQLQSIVTKEGVFAENETFTEIKPDDLKFILIPFFQGEVIQKFMDNREAKLDLALKFYDQFYKKLHSYEYITDEKKNSYKYLTEKPEDGEKSSKPNMEQLNKDRSEKIKMFRYKQALSEKIKKLEKEEKFDNIKDYWISYIELCWIKMLESIKMILLEQDSLKYLKDNKPSTPYNISNENINQNKIKKGMEMLKITPENLKTIDPNHKLLQGIEIKSTHANCAECMNGTHSEIYKGSLGTNVNSIVQNYTNVKENVFRNANQPTMTLDEFADKEIALAKEQEEKQKQYNMEKPSSDSEDEGVSEMKTMQARAWDDWKDNNPKGSGNTKK